LTPAELEVRLNELNPIARIGALAEAGIPAMLIHGDRDTVVPLPENSGEFARRYRQAGAGSLVNLIVLPEQGHSFHPGYFQSTALVDFAIARAKIGAGKATSAAE
jgi:pimeloyl-ACP methyl ester carboxylesterase